MKIKIEADGPVTTRDLVNAIRNALLQTATIELLDCYPAGDHFKMDDDRRGISIALTVIIPQKA